MKLLDMSAAGALLIAAVLLLRGCALHRLPKWTFLLLWGTALCRLLIPLSVPSPLSVCNAPAWAAAVVQRSDPEPAEGTAPSAPTGDTASPEAPVIVVPSVPRTPAEDRRPAAAPEPEKTSLSPVRVIYFTGAALCALFFTAACLRCLLAFRKAEPAENEALARWQEAHPRVRLRRSGAVAAPLTYGLFRPVILLPQNTDWSDEEQLTCVLTHEYIHVRRGDLFWKLLLAAALCVHWFNPLVWAMYFCANRDLELACDEAAIRTLGLEHRKGYALSLLSAEASRGQFLPLCSGYGSNQTEERILAIMKLKKRSVWAALTALILVIGTVAIFATGPVPDRAQPVQPPAETDVSRPEPAPSHNPALPAQRPEQPSAQPEPAAAPAEPEPDTQPEPTEPVPDPQGTKTSAYPVNSKGHTYGKWSEADGYDDVPDLLYVQIDQSTGGYVFREVMYPYSYPVRTQAERAQYLDWYEQLFPLETPVNGDIVVSPKPIYDQEETQIGTCDLIWAGMRYKTREEAQAQLDRGEKLEPVTYLGTAPLENIPAGRRASRTIRWDWRQNEAQEVLVDGDWPRNSAGETYGEEIYAGTVGYYPDLMRVGSREGTVGYIRYEDAAACHYSGSLDSPRGAEEYRNWLSEQPYSTILPVYDLEGNQVGTWEQIINQDAGKTQADIEEELWMVAQALEKVGYTNEEIIQALQDLKEYRDW